MEHCAEAIADLFLNRYVSAGTKALYAKIHQLTSRVRELENGLTESHSLATSVPHPLLIDKLLRIKDPLPLRELTDPQNVHSDSEDEGFVHGLGTL
jgi:hypothetical protein